MGDAVREVVLAKELPDVLDRVQLGGRRRQRQQGDVGAGQGLTRGHRSELPETVYAQAIGEALLAFDLTR